MPIYEYKCPCCGEEAERFCKVDERHAQVCEDCGASLLLRPSIPGGAVWNTDCPTASGGKPTK